MFYQSSLPSSSLSGEVDELLRALFGCHGNSMILVKSVVSGVQLKELSNAT